MDLIEAATAGNIKEIKKLIKTTENIDYAAPNDFPALHYAMRVYPHNTKKPVLECVKILIKAGADPNKEYAAKETPFATACIEGHPDVVKFLFDKKKTDVNIRLENGNSLIEEITIKCANRPRNYTVTTTINGEEVSTSDPEKIRKLGVGHPDDEYKSYQNIVEFLLNNSYKIDSINSKQQTDLFAAIGNDSLEIVNILLAKNAKTKIKDKWGLTPLHYACRHGNLEMANQIIKHGADINAVDDWGFTASHEAMFKCNLELIKLLLEACANLNLGLTKDFDKDHPKGTTAIDIAKKKNCSEILEFIKATIPFKLKEVPYKGWTWNKTPHRYDGVDIQNQKLLWYTHTEHHQGGGAKTQTFSDFLHHGSNAITPPPEIKEEIINFLKEYLDES